MRPMFFSVMLLALLSLDSVADVAVIVHPSNSVSINEDEIRSLFLGKHRSFNTGQDAQVITLGSDQAGRSRFIELALGKNDSQLKAYWAQLLFTGKGVPPKEVTSTEMLKLIANTPNAIGYIDSTQVDGSVKIVHSF